MPKGYHHLTYEQRCQIYTLKKSGLSQVKIGKQIGLSASTISREIRRNSGRRGYRYKQAHRKAIHRRFEASCKAKKLTDAIKARIVKWMEICEASPMQISGRLKKEGVVSVSHETIYRWIINDQKKGGNLYKHLRHRRKKYNKRIGKSSGRGCIPGRVDIDERPTIVEAKQRIGDLEIDTIVGAKHQGAIISVVDRASKYTWLRLVERREASMVSSKLIEALKNDRGIIHTLTADNGKEFAQHARIREALGVKVYFAKPYQSWQRGLNEHTNGLVRQYFPKGTSFRNLSEEMIQEVQDRLNSRPRECLSFKTPNEVFLQHRQKANCALHC